jgi:hypothetical protein
MILANTVTSPSVGGVTVSGPADISPGVGQGVVGNGRQWISTPGLANATIVALGVVGSTANIDWSLGGYFSLTTTASTNLTLTFGTTGALTTASYDLGQHIRIRITAGGATVSTVTWPATIAWVGNLTSTGGTSQSAPVLVANKLCDVVLTCTGIGTAPTFDGVFIVGT